MQSLVIIDEVSIRQDAEGRFCLNDLHKAAGGMEKDKPGNWLRLDQTRELISEIDQCSEMSSALSTVVGGVSPGTYVCKELVYAYAMWINPSFHLKVIRIFDAVATGNFNIPQTYHGALRLAADLAEKNGELQLEVAQSNQIINELQPKATYYDLILQNKSLLSVSKIAKDYGKSAIWLNQKLHELGVQFKQGGVWLLYQKYADKGYTQSQTHVIDDAKSKFNTYWTQKGRLFIYGLLKTEGILPLIEREFLEEA